MLVFYNEIDEDITSFNIDYQAGIILYSAKSDIKYEVQYPRF